MGVHVQRHLVVYSHSYLENVATVRVNDQFPLYFFDSYDSSRFQNYLDIQYSEYLTICKETLIGCKDRYRLERFPALAAW